MLTATLGQIRFAPAGRAIGLGMDAALALATARGYAPDVVSILLQEAEAEIIPIINAAVTDGDNNPHLRDQINS